MLVAPARGWWAGERLEDEISLMDRMSVLCEQTVLQTLKKPALFLCCVWDVSAVIFHHHHHHCTGSFAYDRTASSQAALGVGS